MERGTFLSISSKLTFIYTEKEEQEPFTAKQINIFSTNFCPGYGSKQCHCIKKCNIKYIFELLCTCFKCLLFSRYFFRKQHSKVQNYQQSSKIKHCFRNSIKTFERNSLIFFLFFQKKKNKQGEKKEGVLIRAEG